MWFHCIATTLFLSALPYLAAAYPTLAPTTDLGSAPAAKAHNIYLTTCVPRNKNNDDNPAPTTNFTAIAYFRQPLNTTAIDPDTKAPKPDKAALVAQPPEPWEGVKWRVKVWNDKLFSASIAADAGSLTKGGLAGDAKLGDEDYVCFKDVTSLLKPNSTISPVGESDHESMDEDEPTDTPEKDSSAYSQSHEGSAAQQNSKGTSEGWFPSREFPKNEPVQDDLLTTDNDIVDRGIISKDLAESLLNIYREELFSEYPGITIGKEVTAEQLRSKKPALFHAVMAAASQGLGQVLSNKLHEELIYFYARSLFVKGEKSLQHVQALFVSVAYYTPPVNPGQMQIYQYTNLAASMALELGLASKPRTHEQLPKRAIRSLQRISSAEELLEHCRTILSLYTLIAGPKTQDKRLIAWLRLQRIADEAYTAFGFDDASTSFTLSELRLQAILKIFERRMQEWKKAVPEEVMTRYDAPEFRNRHMTLPALDEDACIQPESLLSRSSLQVNATIMCISAAHSILDCFLQLPVDKLQKAAGVVFVRSCVALVTLLKVDYAVGTDAEGMGEVIDSTTLKIDYYLDSVIKLTAEAAGPQKCKIPGHWHFIIKEKLKTWPKSKPSTKPTQPHRIPKFLRPQHTPLNPSLPPRSFTTSTGSDQTPQNQNQSQLPDFNMGANFPTWQAPAYRFPVTSATQTPAMNDQGFGPDMTDFSAAFQNGDLYLWDDINDNFGGWMPQGGNMYSSMQFGGMNMGI
ncbi:hypothetical protein N0V90_001361 [Kalmusia sp. IMI 367209]|nr:hypothetical protein N0V90_001361 [Kalmusia sp. IMI 367209]